MRIIVDRARCTGIGICESVDPDRFEVGADGALVLLRPEWHDEERERVEEAIRSCPAAALRLELAS
jgi:ferredoxin